MASTDWKIRGTFGTGADCQAFGPRYDPKQWWCEEHARRGYWILWVEA